MPSDLPPPYTALTRHPMMPQTSHDEAARFNFLTHFNRFLSGAIGKGNALAYEQQAKPAFAAEHGREPETRHDVREAMNATSWHRTWSALKRNSMEMRQHNGRQTVLRQIDNLDAAAAKYNAQSGQLELDTSVDQPWYQRAVDIHCQPGGYHSVEREGDVVAGANYDIGIFATTGGALGGLNDGGGQAVVEWAKRERPDWQPKRILDIGATVGHNAVPIAQAYPDAEVIAIDTAGASLRYGAARAAAMGVTNIRFVQANGEDLSRWDDGTLRLGPDHHVPARAERQGHAAPAGRSEPRAGTGRADFAHRTAAIFGRHAAVRTIHARLGCVQQQRAVLDRDARAGSEAGHGRGRFPARQPVHRRCARGGRSRNLPAIARRGGGGFRPRRRMERLWRLETCRTGACGVSDEPLDWVALAGKRARGERPAFFDEPALDRLYSVVFALAGEVSVLRERLDTVERLLDAKGTISRADIETYEPDREAGEERGLATRAYIARIMRGFQQEAEAMEAASRGEGDPPLTELVEKLGKE